MKMTKKFLVSIFILTTFFTQSAFAELSLSDLNFNKDQIKVDPEFTKISQERHRKLQIHQKLGLATMAAMTATILVADNAKSDDVHKIAGITTGLLYWTTAYYSLSAPEVEGTKDTGSSKIHKALAWIHAPLMAIVPVLGYMNKENARKGKESTGLVAAHGGLASAAYISFMAAGLTMYFDF